jgi:hypothetical protein
MRVYMRVCMRVYMRVYMRVRLTCVLYVCLVFDVCALIYGVIDCVCPVFVRRAGVGLG